MSQTHPLNNAKVMVEGTVDFARTASQIEGEELTRRVARDRSQFPTNTPHTLLEISQIQIVGTGPADANGYATLNEAEQFIQSKTFTRKDPEKGLCLTLENKTKNLPVLLAHNPQLGAYEQVVQPEGEIAPGTRVKALLRVYLAPKYNKLGFNLEAILVDTPEVPYASGRGNLDLSAYGITLAGPLVNTESAAGSQGVPAQPQNVAAGTDPNSGLPAAPSQQAQAPAQQQQQQPQQQPQQQQAPVQQGVPAQQPQQQYQAPPAPAQNSPVVPPAAQYQIPNSQAPQGQDPFAGQNPQWGGQGIVAPE